MRVAVELEPAGAEAARVLGEWRAVWSVTADSDEVDLAPAKALAALLDLKERCYDRGLTLNAAFPDNT